MSTRFLVLSDTHDDAFPNDTRKADVVLHCGDLTMIGGMSNYHHALENIKQMDSELKLVIPGNYDVSLDTKWWADNLDEGDDPDEPSVARELFRQENANGLYLLDEGTHTFTIYCSPYTPEFNGYAFAYHPDEDRFNQGISPIPEGVDIVMTHGPPLLPSCDEYQLDLGRERQKLWLPEVVQRNCAEPAQASLPRAYSRGLWRTVNHLGG